VRLLSVGVLTRAGVILMCILILWSCFLPGVVVLRVNSFIVGFRGLFILSILGSCLFLVGWSCFLMLGFCVVLMRGRGGIVMMFILRECGRNAQQR
jgi:hypothetical protein